MKRFLCIGTGLLLAFLAVIAGIVFLPAKPYTPIPNTFHYASFEAAVADVANFDTKEATQVREECKSVVLQHGQKTANAIVIFHGYTNCPKQFAELGQRLYDKGYNVLIARAPGHGYSDRLTEALGAVTFEDFSAYISRSASIGAALGDKVTAVGLSAGGTFALWSALYEPQITNVVAISPVAYPRGFDPILRDAVIKYAALVPNEFKWWSDDQKNDLPGPPYAYRRYSTRSMGIVMHMASTVEQALRSGMHPTSRVTIIANYWDKALYDTKIADVSALFDKAGGPSDFFEFTDETSPKKDLPHDLIDPYNIKDAKDFVYGKILEIIDESLKN